MYHKELNAQQIGISIDKSHNLNFVISISKGILLARKENQYSKIMSMTTSLFTPSKQIEIGQMGHLDSLNGWLLRVFRLDPGSGKRSSDFDITSLNIFLKLVESGSLRYRFPGWESAIKDLVHLLQGLAFCLWCSEEHVNECHAIEGSEDHIHLPIARDPLIMALGKNMNI